MDTKEPRQYKVWVKWSNGDVSVCHTFDNLDRAKLHASWHRMMRRGAQVEKVKLAESSADSDA